jgi:hypothetical protein
VSRWVRDLPTPPRLTPEAHARRTAERMRQYWAAERPARSATRAAAQAKAAARIGSLTDREILIAGAVAYWCEGSKAGPSRPAGRVIFTNSDPELVSFFLVFLDTAGVPRSDLVFRLQIHENAQVEAAERFWLSLTEAHREQFRRTFMKADRGGTSRKNTGEDYHGCLRVEVRGSAEPYRKIKGWTAAAAPLPEKDLNLH